MSNRELPRSIDAYLKQLKRALQGADKALIQDALYDAEEYLRNELRENSGRTESELLAGIATTYGAPEEVADAYRQTEKTVQAALRTPRPHPRSSAFGRFFGVIGDPNAWTAMLFLLLGLPVGIFLFTWAVTGLSLAVGLATAIFGMPFFLLFIASVRGIALVEGRLVEVLLGVRMPRRPVHPGQPKSFIKRIVDMLKDGRTWSTILYMLLKLPLGIAGYVLVVTGVAVSLGFIAGAPIVQGIFGLPFVAFNDFGFYLPWYGQVGLAIVGILLLFAMMHVFRWFGIFQAHVARALLVKTTEPVSNNGSANAPAPSRPALGDNREGTPAGSAGS